SWRRTGFSLEVEQRGRESRGRQVGPPGRSVSSGPNLPAPQGAGWPAWRSGGETVGIGLEVPGGVLEGAGGAGLLLRPVLHLHGREGEVDRFHRRVAAATAARPLDVVHVDLLEGVFQVDEGDLAAGLAQGDDGGVVEGAHAAALEQAGRGVVRLL